MLQGRCASHGKFPSYGDMFESSCDQIISARNGTIVTFNHMPINSSCLFPSQLCFRALIGGACAHTAFISHHQRIA